MNLNSGWDEGPSDILEDILAAKKMLRKQTGYSPPKEGTAMAITKKNYNGLSDVERQGLKELFGRIIITD